MTAHRSGFVAVVGLPNVGKSTLVNALTGRKVAGVSAKPQTTRRRILGVRTELTTQFIFVDTPGLSIGKTKLADWMSKTAAAATREADVILLVLDAEHPGDGQETGRLLKERPEGKPIFLLLNKVDKVNKPILLPLMQKFHDTKLYAEIIPISALTGDGVDLLPDLIRPHLPEGPAWFTQDEAEAAPIAALVQEVVQERLFSKMHQEIPYGCAVMVDTCAMDGEMLRADATILVDRESHKGMVIGKGGAMIKMVGTESRLELERVLLKKVAIKLNVKVEPGWRDREAVLSDLGYRQDPA